MKIHQRKSGDISFGIKSNDIPLKLLRYGDSNIFFWSVYINNKTIDGNMINPELPTYEDKIEQLLTKIGDSSFKITDKYNITASSFMDFIKQLQPYELIMNNDKKLIIQNTELKSLHTGGGKIKQMKSKKMMKLEFQSKNVLTHNKA